jgi:hypothetical protein
MRASSPSLLTLTALACWSHTLLAADASCQARSGAQVTPVVELYTSEGCNSCPPADKWLSRLKAESSTVALAFHVDYWDRLGWKDRFASPTYTQRQGQQQASNGARFSYTPQVVVDGADRKDWGALDAPPARASASSSSAATVALTLTREGERFSATVQALVMPQKPGATPARLAAYWAVTEQDHVTAVKAGENQGVTLRHDFVVREYKPVAAWPVDAAAPTTLSFSPSVVADPAHPRQINLVVVDAATGRPVQALKLGC